MAFAAAAVAGARRGRTSAGLHKTSGRSFEPASQTFSGPNVSTCIGTCGCLILSSIGISLLAQSTSDERGTKVADYDSVVERWSATGRDRFSAAVVKVEARGKSTLSGTMQLSDAAEKDFRDVEHGKGLVIYSPLKFEYTFQFDSYYPPPAAPNEELQWEPLPTREAATSVTFEFNMRNGNGTQSKFSLPAFPLVFDEVVRARTPAPENKCKREQSGTWRDRHCHVVRRLSQICLQVEPNEHGQWSPTLKDVAATSDNSQSQQARSEPSISGCDPHDSWSVSTYSIDPCWGASPSRSSCASHEKEHSVRVIIRSASDPFIRAEELTGTSLNFGMSQNSQRSLGITTFIIGLVLGIVPVLRIRSMLKKPSRSRSEDCRGLRYHRDDTEDQKIGIYGNRMM